jgi:hypothetical protein
VALVALLLSGCWLQGGADAGNTRSNPGETALTRANVEEAAIDWRAPVGAVMSEPLVSGGRVYVSNWSYDDDAEGSPADVLNVQAYDASTGALAWERSLLPPGDPDDGLIATPAIVDGAVWVTYWHDGFGCDNGRLARLDAATGAMLSEDPTGSYPSPVVAFDGLVSYVEMPCTGPPRVVVRDAATRAVRWTGALPAGSGVMTPTVAEGRLFVLADGTLHAYDADGCGSGSGTPTCPPLWTEAVGDGAYDFQRLVAAPGGNLVTWGAPSTPEGWPATIVVRDAATGDVRWEAEARNDGPLPWALIGVAVSGGTLYVAGSYVEDSGPDPIAVLDAYPLAGCGAAVCAPAWTADLDADDPSGSPTVAGGVVYVPVRSTSSRAPAVVAVDAAGCGAPTCDEVTRFPLMDEPGFFFSGIYVPHTSVADGRLHVAWSPPSLAGEATSELVSVAAPSP